LASTAIALNLDSDKVTDVRIALGGIASVPWRAKQAEQFLAHRTLDEESAAAAADIAFKSAKVREHNRYKVLLGKQILVRGLLAARDMEVA
jgi:xanthine dehydrogenase YagS FAD-binding subunit